MSQWNVVYTNKLISNGNTREKNIRDKKAQDMINAVPSMKIEELKKYGDELYEVARSKEDYLISGYNDKKLKSKALIKSAKKTIAKRAKEASENVTESAETNKTEE